MDILLRVIKAMPFGQHGVRINAKLVLGSVTRELTRPRSTFKAVALLLTRSWFFVCHGWSTNGRLFRRRGATTAALVDVRLKHHTLHHIALLLSPWSDIVGWRILLVWLLLEVLELE